MSHEMTTDISVEAITSRHSDTVYRARLWCSCGYNDSVNAFTKRKAEQWVPFMIKAHQDGIALGS